MLSKILCSIVILTFFLYSAEVFHKYRLKALSRDKRYTANIDKLMEIYKKTRTDSWTINGVIPHPNCHIPFYTDGFWTSKKGPYICMEDDFWCSKVATYIWKSGKFVSCVMKGSELADSNKWSAHEKCSVLFVFHNGKNNYYYKGCTTAKNAKTPWCSHNLLFEDDTNAWSYCKLNGGWSAWSGWSECTKSCGSGSSRRDRECNNPSPQHGGKDCEGKTFQTIVCNTFVCPIDGQWSIWLPWSSCSKECSGGVRNRTRVCNNPPPQYKGKMCVGEFNDTGTCNNQACEVVDIVTPSSMFMLPPFNEYRHLEFLCKIYVKHDEDFRVNKIKWKYQQTTDSPLIDIPPSYPIDNRVPQKVSVLIIPQFSASQFGLFHCIYDKRPYHPIVSITGVSLSINPNKLYLPTISEPFDSECQYKAYGMEVDVTKIKWRFKHVTSGYKNSLKIHGTIKVIDKSSGSSQLVIFSGPTESLLGVYECSYNGHVGASVEVFLYQNIKYEKPQCLLLNSECDDTKGSLCCAGLICNGPHSVKHCVVATYDQPDMSFFSRRKNRFSAKNFDPDLENGAESLM